jgi:hypothetical protein
MNAETYVEWLRRQGHRVIRTLSSYWCDHGPRVYQAVPYHWRIQPSEQELRQLLVGEGAIALRYSTPIEAALGKASYHVVLEGAGYGLELLSANARSTVQRGLKRCRVARIPLNRLAEEGWRLQRDTQERQGRVGSLDQTRWKRLSLAAQGLPGFEAWGAIVHGDLAATILTACVDGVCNMLYPQSHRDYFTSYANNVLAYTVTHEMLSRPGVKSIFYGLHSLDAPASVDEFKFRMGYVAKTVRQRVVFHPWLRPAVNRASHVALQYLRHRRPTSPTLAKAEGMCRFYLDGQRPLHQQAWPTCLRPAEARSVMTTDGEPIATPSG